MNDFRRISFGLVSAEAERNSDPGLILDGNVDILPPPGDLLSGQKYLFLGYKGTGKSSIGEKIQLSLGDREDRFIKLISLADFPFTPFSKIVRGNVEPEAKYPTAWSWILLIYLLESFGKDEGIAHPDKLLFLDAIKAFREMGLSPTENPATIVRTSAKKDFSLALPGKLTEFKWSGSEARPASEIPDFVESLKGLIRGVKSQSFHTLIIDGLDDILTTREIQYKSLSALIFEVNRLNVEFGKYNVPAKILLLCRTDLFERIPGANKNKVRQDYSLELDWFHDPKRPGQSMLVEAAQLRTNRSLGCGIDLFGDLVPKNTIKRLLDMTRHTPRDFLQLLTHVQKFSSAGIVHFDAIQSGMRDYSRRYFLPEIQDELSGYAVTDEINRLIVALGRVGKRDFFLSELVSASSSATKSLPKERVFELVEALFNCSGLGNVKKRPNGDRFYTFKYINRYSAFNEEEPIMLHRGLWRALNIG